MLGLISIIDEVTATLLVEKHEDTAMTLILSHLIDLRHINTWTCMHYWVWDCNSAVCVINFRSN